jgi:hypothetical protein
MSDKVGEIYLESVIRRFRVSKQLAEAGLKQLDDNQMRQSPASGSNSIAVIMQHLHGNMVSRWTDFLFSDGEKATRNRDAEFVLDATLSRKERMARWEEGWSCLLGTLEGMTPADLTREVVIRGKTHTVVDAIERQVFHVSYHVGQMLYLAKLLKGGDWRYLSIRPGQSRQYRPGAND